MTSTTTIDSQRGAISHRRDRIFLSPVDTYENVDLNRGSFNDTSDRVRVSAAQVLQGRPAVMASVKSLKSVKIYTPHLAFLPNSPSATLEVL